MDTVFKEEQKNLAKIETKIDTVASRYERKADELQAEIADFYCVDYDDRMKKRELLQERAKIIILAEQFRDYQPSPYFARLDLDVADSEESVTYFIGKEGISDGRDKIVVDWRTPVGSCYYAANQREFSINGNNYILALRRSLEIKKGVLVSYRTEYDGEEVSLEGDVIDPFLLTVLNDKRRHNRLTDIIRTIQGNQNEVIRRPREESFVVQGCAGSGKTMILLHRLSYLKFNNRSMSLNGVKIITPNKFFDAHINDLSVELGLTAIERFSVEEYYVSLIKRYSSKIVASAEIQSEKTLSVDLLTDVYSLQYLSESISHYHEYWDNTLRDIEENKLKSYFDNFKINYPDTTIHTVDTFSLLEYGIKKINSAIAELDKKRKSLDSRLFAIGREIDVVQAEYEKVCTNLKSAKEQAIKQIENEIHLLSVKQKEIENRITELRKRCDELQTQRDQLGKEIVNCERLYNLLSSRNNIYPDYDRFVRLDDDWSKVIRTRCSVIITLVVETEKSYKATPIYNFGKRNNLRKKVVELKEQFAGEVIQILSEHLSEIQSKKESLQLSVDSLTDELAKKDELIMSLEKKHQEQLVRLNSLQECSVLFASNELPAFRTSLLPAAYKACESIVSYYEEQRNISNKVMHRLSSFAQTKQNLEVEQQELAKSEFNSEDSSYMMDCYKVLKRLQYSEISKSVMFRDLLNKYRQHNQKYRKINYRHKLYLKLLYCSLYYVRLLKEDNFLNIDEAQDISVAEYRLLRMVLGDKCVFNLYGDINQSVYSYKGIVDWDEVADITSGNIYVLNENYRNTLQVTQFCNKEFSAEVYPIGVSGEPVVEYDTATAVQWILDVKKKNPDYRVAIIHRHGIKAIQELLRTILINQDVSWYSVDEKKLSVLSVEIAKGLEFEAVVAIVDQMSNNEKYISYTRALDSLSVVRDNFSAELDIDDCSENIDDEFADVEETPTEYSAESTQLYAKLAFVLASVVKQLNVKVQDEPTYASSDNTKCLYKTLVTLLSIVKKRNTEENADEQLHKGLKRTEKHLTGQFYSWEILDEITAVKSCDKSFFEYNGSGVPREICWFFDSGSMSRGDSKRISIVFEGKLYTGKIAYELSEHSRMRITWNSVLGDLLSRHKNIDNLKAIFKKTGKDTYRLTIVEKITDVFDVLENQVSETKAFCDSSYSGVSLESGSYQEELFNSSEGSRYFLKEETAMIAEFNLILEERFGSGYQLSLEQQDIILSLYRRRSVACNAPSGSMKSVMLYLLALKEHQTSGKQTLLTAEAHLQENELVLADKLGLKCGIVNSMYEFKSDFKKDKYDIIFVSYEFFKRLENVGSFIDYFSGKVAYWGFDHPAVEQAIWLQLVNCSTALESTMYLMSKDGFEGLNLSDFYRYEVSAKIELNIVKKLTFLREDERLKWLLCNLDELYGQGLIYCNDELTSKTLSKHLRKNKILAEAYIDVANQEKRERVNYLTNSFSCGGLPVLVTTHNIGKNLSNPNIRFVIHYDIPSDEQLYKLHVSQIGKLAKNPVVYDLRIIKNK